MIFDYKAIQMICFMKKPELRDPVESPHFPSSSNAMVCLSCKEITITQKYLGPALRIGGPADSLEHSLRWQIFDILKMDLGFGNGQESFGAWIYELCSD